jgi:hypothetical protein
MKRNLFVLGIISFLFFTLSGCGISSGVDATKGVPTNTNNSLEPKQVIENYFKYYNEKNRQGLLSTLSSRLNKPNVIFGFENLKSIKLVRIENDDINSNDSYLKYGAGKVNGVKENNVVSYKVTYESVYSKDTPPWSSGKKTEYFTLIKESDNAQWLIDDHGQP